ncbi:hypothetical protein F0562_023302 [Nyssa sinensis]|uniref:C3H1-type domain-containing protein n=1 Tax=Nyssa sinensis TaxID=561372 RepID=A0A5J5BIR3_9ASTE|nr:hypothetical protein F0562_023302 [Nyssa sinensis]
MQKTSEPSTPSMGRVSSIEKAVGGMRSGEGEYPERVGQPECLYYMKIAVCRLGPSCKYYHLRVREGGGSVGPMALNIFGRRPHYMKTRICNFGESCKYHHPRVGQGRWICELSGIEYIWISTTTRGKRVFVFSENKQVQLWFKL